MSMFIGCGSCVPSLQDTLTRAEEKLSKVLGGVCKITVHHQFPSGLAKIVEEIEARQFRQDLRYSIEELMERSRRIGFTCILFSLDGKPFAFDLGYDNEEKGVYFGDSAATIIERKGVGAVLTALDALYSWEAGYHSVKMVTEEEDQLGRRLREYWERFGFRVTAEDPSFGVEMKLDLTPEVVRFLCDKYIG
jgi:hypothetical protein